MKLVIGSFIQETNSFSTFKTDLQSFKESEFLMGDEIISYHSKKRTEIGAFIEVAGQENVQLLPLVSASYPGAGGIVTAETYQKIKMLFLEKLRQIKQFDGVLLALHGAMAVEGLDDPEGNFLEAVRTQVGKDIPIVSSFDLHANFTKKMMDNLDALAGYNTHPHIDIFETGERAINIMISILKKKIKPTMAMKRLPMIIACSMDTTHGPLKEAMKMAKAIEKESSVVSTAIFAVQPWLDLYDTGFSVVVVTDNNLDLAQRKANEIARMLWESRKKFAVEELTVEEALMRAREIEGGPIVFSDSANHPQGGADGTYVLKKLVDMGLEFPVALTITDSEAVQKCIEKGVGERITVEVGGKINKNFTQPLLVNGYIKTISDGKYKNKGKFLHGVEQNMGKTVVLVVNRNIYLVITELRAATADPEQFISLGISPKEMKIIIVKSVSDFKANYGLFAKEIIMLDTPGPCSSNLLGLPFKNIKRPMYPWDQMDDYKI
jgi:microcystin degradation protein MlrC